MKKFIIILLFLISSVATYAQVDFYDYVDGAEFECFGETYKVSNIASDHMHSVTNGLHIQLRNTSNFRFEHSAQYKDGTYTNNDEDVYGIIKHSNSYDRIFRHAMRNVFSKRELTANPKNRVVIFVIVNNQGSILETITSFEISEVYSPQPEQIAALETMIRKNLKFELDQEKASKFNYFEGMIWLYFGKYIDGVVDESTDDLYTIRVAVNEIGSPTPSLGSGSGPLKP